MLSNTLCVTLWLAALATCQATTATGTTNACAELSSSASVQRAQTSKATPTFAPSLVHRCLQDVPVNKTIAAAYIEWIEAFVQFQTTLSYLKDPPSIYQQPAVDVLGELSSIKQNVAAGQYDSDLALQYDIFKLFNDASDGHFVILPFTVYAFQFQRQDSLVSISPDGVELPSLYLLSDVMLAASNAEVNISKVVRIEGMDDTAALLTPPQMPWFQDLDASYNAKLYNPATEYLAKVQQNDNWVLGRAFHDEDTTTYVFENGTRLSRANVASQGAKLPDVDFDTGAAFFSQYLLPTKGGKSQQSAASTQSAGLTAGSSAASSSPTATTQATQTQQGPPKLTGYPKAVIEHSQDMIAGYFLDGADTSDVAVLNIASFQQVLQYAAEAKEFQTILSKFLKQCQGKKRLIIDVRGNGGGTLFLAYDAFKQLFPSLGTPYSGVRFRAQKYTDMIGLVTTIAGSPSSPFSAKSVVQSPDGKPFANWSSLYGPHEVNDDNFSTVASWRFDSAPIDLESSYIVVSGYANNTDIPPSPFDASSVTILTDGSCSSTCAVFVNLLVNQAGVKSVVAGGRPSYAPMALIGGTQGGQEMKLSLIQQAANQAIGAWKRNQDANQTRSKTVTEALSILTQPAPINILDLHINFKDNIAKDDTTQTPLQFTSKPADCRMFYMAADVLAVNSTWERIAKGVAADGKGLCINGTVQSWISETYGGEASGTIRGAWVSATAATAAIMVLAFQTVSGIWV